MGEIGDANKLQTNNLKQVKAVKMLSLRELKLTRMPQRVDRPGEHLQIMKGALKILHFFLDKRNF